MKLDKRNKKFILDEQGEVDMNRKQGARVFRNQHGMTMIEIMVVMIIIGLLAALVAPRMFGKLGKAKTNAAFAQIEMLGTALDSFRLDVGRYPDTSEGLEALLSPVSGADEWNGPYLKKNEIPQDPWNVDYVYQSPGNNGDYDLSSLGADKAEGGEGEDHDIVSWKGLK
jgi:general secretion pathway protein G